MTTPPDPEALYRQALYQYHGGSRLDGETLPDDHVAILLDSFTGKVASAYAVAFVIASRYYEPTADWGDPKRVATVKKLTELTCDQAAAYRACAMVDLMARLDPRVVGAPTPAQLYAAVRSPLKRHYPKKRYGVYRSGWRRLKDKLIKAGGFEALDRAAVAAMCRSIHDEILAEAKAIREVKAAGASVTNIADHRAKRLSDKQPPPYPLDSGAKPQPHAERRTEGGRRHEVAAEQVRPIGAIVEASRGFDEWGDQFMRVLAGQTHDAIELAFEHLYDWQLRARVLALLPAVGAKPRNIVHAATATRAELLKLLVEVAQQYATEDEAVVAR